MIRSAATVLPVHVVQRLCIAGAESSCYGFGLQQARMASRRFYGSQVFTVRTKDVDDTLPVRPMVHSTYNQPKSVDFNTIRHSRTQFLPCPESCHVTRRSSRRERRPLSKCFSRGTAMESTKPSLPWLPAHLGGRA